MRRVLAALAAAALLPTGGANAADPYCQTADNLLLGVTGHSAVCHARYDSDRFGRGGGAFAFVCERITATPPAATMPSYEEGDGACRNTALMVNENLGQDVDRPDNSWAYFTYWSDGRSTLAESRGTFRIVLPQQWGLTLHGTYHRVGSTWTLEHVNVPEPERLLHAEVVEAAAEGLPASNGYQLVVTGAYTYTTFDH